MTPLAPLAPPAAASVARVAPSDVPRDVPEATALLERADRAIDARDFDAAMKLLEEALRLDPASPRARAALGWATFRSQPTIASVRDEARRHLLAALAADPRLVRAKVSLARILRLEDDLAGARQELKEAVAIDPFHEEARRDLDALEELSWRRGG